MAEGEQDVAETLVLSFVDLRIWINALSKDKYVRQTDIDFLRRMLLSPNAVRYGRAEMLMVVSSNA
jgi:hypothetical protein